MRTYRHYLKAIGRPPLKQPDLLRTVKAAGDVEFGWCPRRKEHVAFRVVEGAGE
jgi:hypothetical protein